MGLISLRQLLDQAAENGYALPAFNVNNLEYVQAVMRAANETDSPVILQASRGARDYAGGTPFFDTSSWARPRNTPIPHLPASRVDCHGELTRYFHRDLTRLLGMFRVWCCGQVPVFLLCVFRFMRRAIFEAETVVSGFEDVAVMRQPVEQRRRHLGIAEDAGPFAEAEVGALSVLMVSGFSQSFKLASALPRNRLTALALRVGDK